MIKHIRCGNTADQEGVTLEYDYYCPSCDEDLDLSECSFETVDGFKTYVELLDFLDETEVSVVKNKDGFFVGSWKGEESAVTFDFIANCYVYCYDFVVNGYKT